MVCVGACIVRRHDALHASIVCFVAQDGERGGEGEGEGPFTLSRPLCVEWLT